MSTTRSLLLAVLLLPMFVGGGCAQDSQIETIPAGPDARRHLPANADQDYGTQFPTSGPHAGRWTETGFYTQPQPPTQLVHALEHGNIVIYYDRPGESVTARLKEWANAHPRQWEGIVVTPLPGLGEQIVLTAWERLLILPRYDEEKAAAFIDAFRGRGPENPVR